MLLLLREKRLRASPLVARSTTARILFDVAGSLAIIKTIREMRELTIRGVTFARKKRARKKIHEVHHEYITSRQMSDYMSV